MVSDERALPDMPAGFRWVTRPWGLAIQCLTLGESADHGWTTRDLALEGDEAQCAAGWQALAAAAGVARDHLVSLRQVHSGRVVTASDSGAEADAVITRDAGRLLTVRVADCIPLLVADRRTGAVAAVHAGWRGAAAGIAGHTVRRLAEEYGCAAGDLVCAIGPSIRACCYEVGPELVDAFLSAGWSRADIAAWFSADPRPRLDVARATRDQLASAGVATADILDSGLCTACHPALFYSYRRDKGLAGRMVGYIRTAR